MKQRLTLGTRGSKLAMLQADLVRNALLDAFPKLEITIKTIKTEGDIDRSSPLSNFGGRGAFVRSIETALLGGVIDAAVHSLKDLPSELPDGLVLGSAPLREDPRDALLTRTGGGLDSIPRGSTVGTGSERRSRQLEHLRPDIACTGIRGNVETRLRKLDEGSYDAVVLAAAGLKRLGLEARISKAFHPDRMLPAPCQGAIGVECRADDAETLHLLDIIDDPDIRICTDAERLFINTLGMGCHTPVGALAVIDGDDILFRAYAAREKDSGEIRNTVRATARKAHEIIRDLAIKFRTELE